MKTANNLFLEALNWLQNSYGNYTFYLERDIVWTVQQRLIQLVKHHDVNYQVFNDYPVVKANRRSLCADIAIVSVENKAVELVAEFKYEPAHNRSDIPKSKFPVVFWGKDGVGKDVERIHTFVRDGITATAYSIFVDEGGAFRKLEPHPNSHWVAWGDNRWILFSSATSRINSTSLINQVD